ncbi:unnamed protein product [Parnassius mnemosyne]|uniref:THAP domain-containing protein 9 n=1 Tax=Parnassius mnemosyne TaxID=213953 RepID=A0AAV1MA24_9NEOP
MSVTFDGIASNINMVRILGANLDHEPYKPFFIYKSAKIYTIFDACHLLKLIRNAFADFKTFYRNDDIISYYYITSLNELQEKIQLNLANKLTYRHVNYFKNKMKVKLAAQLLSNSVATSIEYCEKNTNIPEFKGANATVNFIRIVNNTFDIFNSRNLLSPGFKKPINSNNVNMIFKELDRFTEFMQSLTLENYQKVITSNRKLGFLGFIFNIQSLKMLYNDYINSDLFKFLPLYKLSQDHLETFFSCIRSRGGFDNNPSARSFISAYKRLLCHAEIQISDNTNCLPIQNVTILALSNLSTMQRLNLAIGKTEDHVDEEIAEFSVSSIHEEDDFLVSLPYTQGKEVIKIVVQYISGYIVKALQKKLKCADCIAVLHSQESDIKSLIFHKDKGGLIYPSKDVIDVCLFCETIYRENIRFKNLNKNQLRLIITRTIYNFLNKFSTLNDHCFPSLNDHIYDQDPINNHKYLLVKLIIEKFFIIRIKYEHKLRNVNKDSIRQFYNKMIIFKGT